MIQMTSIWKTKWILISWLKPSDLDLHCFKPGYILAQPDKNELHRDAFKHFCRADQDQAALVRAA